ncbi:uncharacterized protein GJ701_009185 isoform 1-T2 [Geothlypis trichas]
MVILGSHRHSGNNRMSGPDMSSREKNRLRVAAPWERSPLQHAEPAALVPCPASGGQLGGLSAAQPGRGATLGAAGQATNSCRRPARRGIATGAGGGTGSSGSCEKASGAAGPGGGRSGGAEEEEEAAGAALVLPPGTAPLRTPPKAAGLRPLPFVPACPGLGPQSRRDTHGNAASPAAGHCCLPRAASRAHTECPLRHCCPPLTAPLPRPRMRNGTALPTAGGF